MLSCSQRCLHLRLRSCLRLLCLLLRLGVLITYLLLHLRHLGLTCLLFLLQVHLLLRLGGLGMCLHGYLSRRLLCLLHVLLGLGGVGMRSLLLLQGNLSR